MRRNDWKRSEDGTKEDMEEVVEMESDADEENELVQQLRECASII